MINAARSLTMINPQRGAGDHSLQKNLAVEPRVTGIIGLLEVLWLAFLKNDINLQASCR